jgi:hypothetical protein
MLTCPNKSSKEWKEVLAEANGIEAEALKLWTQKYPNEETDPGNPIDITDYPTENTVGEQADPDDENTEFKKVVNEIKTFLKKQLAILKRKTVTNQAVKEGKIQKTIEQLEGLDEAEAIDTFITEAYNQAISVRNRYSKFLKDKNSMNKKDAIKELVSFHEFANGYNILDEISSLNLDKFFNVAGGADLADSFKELLASNDMDNTELISEIRKKLKVFDSEGKFTAEYKLGEAIITRDNIKKSFVKESIPLMADFLWQYKSDYKSKNLDDLKAYYTTRIEELESDTVMNPDKKAKRLAGLKQDLGKLDSFVTDKKGLEELLKLTLNDEGVFDYLVSPLISSPDAVLALFAKSVKSQLEKARINSLKTRDEVLDKFDAYAKTASGVKDNPKEFNKGIYEIITSYRKKEDGTKEEINRKAFVQKYDISGYNKAQEALYAKLGPKPPKTATEVIIDAYYTELRDWYAENAQPIAQEEIDRIIAEKQKLKEAKIITEDQYTKWLNSVRPVNKKTGEYMYLRELSQPSDLWLNKAWLDMYNMDGTPKNAKGELHKTLVDTYLKAQELIPKSQRLGYYIPYVPKTTSERLIENGIGKSLKKGFQEKFKTQVYDIGYERRGVEDLMNDEGLSEVSSLASLGGTEVKFLPTYFVQKIDDADISLDLTRSILLFTQMAENYSALNEISGETTMLKAIVGEREVAAQTGKGELLIDAFAKKQGYLKFIAQNGESYSKKHLDAFIDMVIYGEMNKAEEYMNIDFAKITDTVIGFSAITSLAMDAMKGVANGLQGNIQLVIEAAAGDYFSSKNLAKAKGYYALGTPFLKDFGKARPSSLEGQLVEYYDAMQGEFKDQYGRNVSSSMFLRLFNTNTLFFNMHAAEHEIQVTTMFALMDAEKVIDNATGEEISLFEAHKKYGRDGVFTNTDFTEKRKEDFQNRLHALNKRLQGVYNDFDKATAGRYALGRLVLMYRKHMVPAWMRRFKSNSYDFELDDVTQGFYRTFWNTLVKDLFVYKKNILKEWSSYTPFQKAQIHRTLRELALIISMTALIFIMTAAMEDDEDLKKSVAFNHVYYQLIRMRSETMQYYPVVGLPDMWRMVKSPTAATNTIARVSRFVDQFFLTWDAEKLTYQKDTGIWEKGDNKSWAYFLKMIGLTGNNLDPAEAVKGFQGTFNK